MRLIISLLFVLLGAAFIPRASAITTVGPASDPDCDYQFLSDAIGAAAIGEATEIRLVRGDLFEVVDKILVFDRDVHVSGGWSSCSSGAFRNLADPSVISADSGERPFNVFSFDANIPTRLHLEGVIVRGGTAENGGGIRIVGNAEVVLDRAIVEDNEADERGGGIYLDGEDGASLRLQNGAVVQANEAGSSGGGIYCVNGHVDLNDARVVDNLGQQGGGIATNRCSLLGQSAGRREISDNEIRGREGGGILAVASTLRLGSEDSVTLIENNRVPDRLFDVDAGGGIRLSAGTGAALTNVHIRNNRAGAGDGAGIAVVESALDYVTTPSCQRPAGTIHCSSMVGNKMFGRAFDSGAMVIAWSDVTIDGVFFTDNDSARSGPSTMTIYGDSSVVIGNSIFYRNGDGSGSTINVTGNAELELVQSTLVGNSESDASLVALSAARLGLYGNIVENGGRLVRGEANARIRGECNLFSRANGVSLSGSATSALTDTRIGAPELENAAGGDFAPRAGAPSQDACPISALTDAGFGELFSFDYLHRGRPRVVSSASRPVDAGAVERQAGSDPVHTDMVLRTINYGDFALDEDVLIGFWLENSGPDPSPRSNATVSLTLPPVFGRDFVSFEFPTGGAEQWFCTNSTLLGPFCRADAAIGPGGSLPLVVARISGSSTTGGYRTKLVAEPAVSTYDPDLANNEAEIITLIGDGATDLRTFMQFPTEVPLGAEIEFQIVVENRGATVVHRPHVDITPAAIPVASLGHLRLEYAGSDWTCGPTVDLFTTRCERDRLSPGERLILPMRTTARTFGILLDGQYAIVAEAIAPGGVEVTPADNTATSTYRVVDPRDGDVAISHAIPVEVIRGQSVELPITLTNLSSGSVAGQFDLLLPRQIFSDWSLAPGSAFECGPEVFSNELTFVTCSSGLLMSGQSRTATLLARIPDDSALDGAMAFVDGNAYPVHTDATPDNNAFSAPVSILEPPPTDAALAFEINVDQRQGDDYIVHLEDVVRLTATATNHGPDLLISPSVSTIVGAAVSMHEATVPGAPWECAAALGSAHCQGVQLAVIESVRVSHEITIDASLVGQRIQFGSALSSSNDPQIADNSFIGFMQVKGRRAVDASVDLMAPSEADYGTAIDIAVQVADLGPDALLPGALSAFVSLGSELTDIRVISSDLDCALSIARSKSVGTNYVCSDRSVPINDTATVLFRANIPNDPALVGSVVSLVAEVDLDRADDPAPANNRSEIPLLITRPTAPITTSDLSIAVADPAPALPGVVVGSRFTVANHGPDTAARLEATLRFPLELINPRLAANPGGRWSCSAATTSNQRLLRCTAEDLESNASLPLRVRFNVANDPSLAGQTLPFGGSIDHLDGIDPVSGNNSQDAAITIDTPLSGDEMLFRSGFEG